VSERAKERVNPEIVDEKFGTSTALNMDQLAIKRAKTIEDKIIALLEQVTHDNI